MKNVLKATLGVLLFSGLFLFNLSTDATTESSDLPTISVEQTAAFAGIRVIDGDGARDPHSHIGTGTLCYNQVPLACDTNPGDPDPAPAPDPVVVANM